MMTLRRCIRCVLPDTRPDTPFVDGICSPCLSFDKRPQIDWENRKSKLLDLLDKNRNGSGYDCIVPSSGGKDSTYQVMTLLGLGARPLVVTASTCQLTALGRENIDNLARHATTIEVTPNRQVRAKLNRLGLELVGDISWPEHVAIFTIPFKVATQTGIPLIFYGENPQNQYGGPPGTDEAVQMTRRWRSEFGGFLGLRPSDMAGKMGLTNRDLVDYVMPDERAMDAFNVQAHFLGQYIPWDSHKNAEVAIEAGMQYALPAIANWWPWENLDNGQTGIHDHLMFRKFGYGRGCAQISVDVRYGRVSRGKAFAWVTENDGTFPDVYGDIFFAEVAQLLGYKNETAMLKVIDLFTNADLFGSIKDNRPILKEAHG